jgi:clan AA aspartic protease
MGTFHYTMEIGNPEGTHYESVEALVDTGASYTMAPSDLLRRLGVPVFDRLTFVLADGRRVEKEVGQTWVRVGGRAVIRLVVFGEGREAALLGADTLQGLLLAVDPVAHRPVPTHGLLMSAVCHSEACA